MLRERQVEPRLVRAVVGHVVLQIAHHRIGQRRRNQRVLHRHREGHQRRFLVDDHDHALREILRHPALVGRQPERVHRTLRFRIAAQPLSHPAQRLERSRKHRAPPRRTLVVEQIVVEVGPQLAVPGLHHHREKFRHERQRFHDFGVYVGIDGVRIGHVAHVDSRQARQRTQPAQRPFARRGFGRQHSLRSVLLGDAESDHQPCERRHGAPAHDEFAFGPQLPGHGQQVDLFVVRPCGCFLHVVFHLQSYFARLAIVAAIVPSDAAEVARPIICVTPSGVRSRLRGTMISQPGSMRFFLREIVPFM